MTHFQDTLFKVPGCHVKQLQPEDTPALQALLEKSSDYSQLLTGSPPRSSAAASLLTDTPEGKTPNDKFVIGLFTETKDLIGVLDVVRNYPAQHDWWLGLLLFDPQARGQGLGQHVYRAFEAWVSQQGAQRVYLGVLEQNQRAYQFWNRMGFEALEKRPARRFGNVEHVVIVMLRTLTS
jgi:RimJ/RimL family protein N-acetyltransferase